MKTSFWKFFRLFFVIFSLYLLGDAFYRWDAFKYYSSIYEFIPSVALALILWTVFALITSLSLWLIFVVLHYLFRALKKELEMDSFMLYFLSFVFTMGLVWLGKRQLIPQSELTSQTKLVVLALVMLSTIALVWPVRSRAVKVMSAIQERITPLLFLFGILFTLSVPLVAYHTFLKDSVNQGPGSYDGSYSAASDSPNILLVTFDALSNKDMSLYGYERITTPYISEWASQASVFTNLKADSNFTAPTTASMMTGKRVWTHQRYHSHGSRPIRSATENMPLLLKDKGYYNMAFIGNSLASIDELGMSDSFEEAPSADRFRVPVSVLAKVQHSLQGLFEGRIRHYDWVINRDFITYKFIPDALKDSNKTDKPAETVFNAFLDFIGDKPPKPFFAWIHLFPPHAHYLPPEPFMGTFDSSGEYRTYYSQDPLMSLTHREQPENDVYRSRYDEFIKYCDKQFELFMEKLEADGILSNTVVMLSSDHGEIFDHNLITHGNSLYEAETNIPFVVKVPGQSKGLTISDYVEQIDIPATILDLAGIELPAWMEGRSLKPLMQGKPLPYRPVFSMNLQLNPSRGKKITNGMFAVWKDDYKLIHYLKENKSLLFNLKQDPDELHNLMDKEKETGQNLLRLIIEYLDSANEKLPG